MRFGMKEEEEDEEQGAEAYVHLASRHGRLTLRLDASPNGAGRQTRQL